MGAEVIKIESPKGGDPVPTGNDHPIVAPYGLFRASDGDIAVSPSTDVFVARFLKEEEGAELLEALIDMSGGQLPALAVHPGGPNILEAVLQVFKARGWEDNALDHSFHTLHNYGNLGSAAMLFVLARTLAETDADHLATMAFGPGVTVEWGKYTRV